MEKFEVIAKCGHVGKNYYVIKTFPVEAESGKDAAREVRFRPRVKHDRKDAILSVRKIDETQLLELMDRFKQDPYFHCENRQEQNVRCKNRLERFREEDCIDFEKKKSSGSVVYFHKQKLRDSKKYLTKYLPPDDYA